MDIIFDIDGTLMDIEHRKKFVEQKPKDWNSFRDLTSEDTPNLDVFAVAIALQKAGNRILVASGRNKSQRAITLKQLMGQGLVFNELYLRSDNDYRPDYELKSGMLDTMLEVSDFRDVIVTLKVRKQFQFQFLKEFLGWLEGDNDMLVQLLPHTASLCDSLLGALSS